MRLLWTKHKHVDLIAWGLEEPCSHFAIEFGGEFYQSTFFKGYHRTTAEDFFRFRTVVYECHFKIPMRKFDKLDDLMGDMLGARYDFLFFFWLVWRVFLLKIFKFIKIPEHAQRQNKADKLCHEIFQEIGPEIGIDIKGDPASTPYGLYKKIQFI